MRGSENPFPFITLPETADPSAPAADVKRLWVDTDGLLKMIDESSTVTTFATSGGVATDTIWNAAGDLAVGSGSDTAARLAIGATNGMTLARVSGAVAWALPPGYEWDYVQVTSSTSITGTSEGSPTTWLTGTSITYDGAPVVVTVYSPRADMSGNVGDAFVVDVYIDSTIQGRISTRNVKVAAGTNHLDPVWGSVRLTPSAWSHQIIAKAWKSATATVSIGGGSGGSGANLPAFLRVVKV